MSPKIREWQLQMMLIDKQIRDYQKKCKHPKTKKEHKANTGNWDPMDNCYWTEFHCLTCDKRWTESGSK